ncbi:MAG: sugar transferase [Verrucomicrobiota bacterium]
MLGRQQEINLQINQLMDGALIALAFFTCYFLRAALPEWFDSILSFNVRPVPPLRELMWIPAITVPFTPLVLELYGYYRDPLQKDSVRSLRQMTQALLVMSAIVGACVIFLKWAPESRSVLLLFIPTAGLLLLAKEELVKRSVIRRLRDSNQKERLLLVGTEDDVARLEKKLDAVQMQIAEVVERFDISERPLEEFLKLLHEHSVQRVVFAPAHLNFAQIEQAILACEDEGVESWVSADFINTSLAEARFDTFGGRPMIVFRTTPETSWALLLKEFLDRSGAALVLLLSFPLWALAIVGIKLSSPGPVFFHQMRGGRHGKPFTILKFRTMSVDAEEKKRELLQANEMSGPVFKLEKDPRVFPFGAFLRRFSIDELPQLLNVVRGEMSLVGPRPLPVYEVEQIENSSHRRRLSMKPGITCIWQVSGRNQISDFEDWVRLDLQYIDNWSIWLDLKILLQTLPVVLFGSGAR